MSYSKFIIIFSHLPVFAVTIYALLIYKKLKNELKVFSIFLFITGVLQLLSLVLWFNRINNLPILHLLVPMRLVCLAWFYSKALQGFINNLILWIAGGAFLIFTIVNSLFIQTVFTFNSYALTVECILMIIFSLSTFMLFLNRIAAEKVKFSIKSLNWINSGLFIYYSCTLLIFFLEPYIAEHLSLEMARNTWVLHSFFSVVMYCCFFIGLRKREDS